MNQKAETPKVDPVELARDLCKHPLHGTPLAEDIMAIAAHLVETHDTYRGADGQSAAVVFSDAEEGNLGMVVHFPEGTAVDEEASTTPVYAAMLAVKLVTESMGQ